MKLYIDANGLPPEGFIQISGTEALESLASGKVTDIILSHTTEICPSCKIVGDSLCPHHLTGYQLLRWCASTGHWPVNKPELRGRAVERNAMKYLVEKHWLGVNHPRIDHA